MPIGRQGTYRELVFKNRLKENFYLEGNLKNMTKTENLAYKTLENLKNVVDKMPWEDPIFYANWLAQSYYFTRNVTRALAKAAAKCNHQENELHKMLVNGILEERNHDLIAMNDLKTMNQEVDHYDENPSTTAYYSTLMNLIEIDGPKSLLGYSVVLEGLAAEGADEMYARVEKSHGKAASKFLNLHITVDKSHFKDAMSEIAKLPSHDQAIIQRAIKSSAKLYNNLIQEVLEIANQSKSNKVAA